ncbi:pyruvate dehydrogenase complex transcriptional repressor PdhR [Rouxiella sp. T17]|uniref:pyruvate dehydrogenase complex transcriptional repressor PdhR n=1 Tax=Rouxiella sp. T17 TaxID=3085684 RepID=UPI002FC763DB
MAYSKIRQPKLSDAIEKQLESLILEGTLRPGEKLLPERELAKQFDVSRPSLREAIQRLEGKGLLLRRQGGGTFVQNNLWQSFSDPLAELLSDHPESQFDLLETRHALEGIAAYYAALRGTEEDLQRIRDCHLVIQTAQDSGDLDAEADAVMQYQVAVTEATHNMVLLHLLRCMGPMLEKNVRQNFELLYSRREMLPLVSNHRAGIFAAIVAREPEKAREASHRHLAFIEEVLLDLSREHSRRDRSLRRLQQRKEEN